MFQEFLSVQIEFCNLIFVKSFLNKFLTDWSESSHDCVDWLIWKVCLLSFPFFLLVTFRGEKSGVIFSFVDQLELSFRCLGLQGFDWNSNIKEEITAKSWHHFFVVLKKCSQYKSSKNTIPHLLDNESVNIINCNGDKIYW